MKKVFLNWRYYILLILGMVCLWGFFGEPDNNEPMGRWLWMIFYSKGIGFGAGFLLFRLVKRWDAKGFIPELSKILEEDV